MHTLIFEYRVEGTGTGKVRVYRIISVREECCQMNGAAGDKYRRWRPCAILDFIRPPFWIYLKDHTVLADTYTQHFEHFV